MSAFFSELDESQPPEPGLDVRADLQVYPAPEPAIEAFYRTAPWWLVAVLSSAGAWMGIRWDKGSDDVDEATVFEEEVELAKEDGAPLDDLPSTKLFDDGRVQVNHPAQAEAFSSRQKPHVYQEHVLMLDIDHRATLLPSSTDGHSHLIIDHRLDEEAWREIITVLGKHGVIEDGYAQASLRRGETFLRAPWVRKRREQEMRNEAFSAWLDSEIDYTAPREREKWLAEKAVKESGAEEAPPL